MTAQRVGQFGIELNSVSGTTLNGNNVSNNEIGMNLDYSSNSTLIDNTASNNYIGMEINYSGNSTLSGNVASNGHIGMEIKYSGNSRLSGNVASDNTRGIDVYTSSSSTLSGNVASNNYIGMEIGYSGNMVLSNNAMKANSYNFGLKGASDYDFNNQIDTSNTVDGKPIYYVINAESTVYDSSTNAGVFYCIGCTNVSIKDLELDRVETGILLWNTTLSKIENVNTTNNLGGIAVIQYSKDNIISGSNFSNNILYGIDIEASGNNIFNDNNILDNINDAIVVLRQSNNNRFSSNNISDNFLGGIVLSDSNNNTIYNNYFNNNSFNVDDKGNNIWNIKKTAGTNIIGGPNLGGNFWSNYAGIDTDGDGLGDTLIPYNNSGLIVNGGDYLPLVNITPPVVKVTKDFRYGVNFTTVPAQLGTLQTQINYTINKKTGNVTSISPGRIYGVVTIDGAGVSNITVNDSFGAVSGQTQLIASPDKLGGGINIIRYNTTTGVATILTNTTQIISASVNNTAQIVNLTISLDSPLSKDENLMVYIKFGTALKDLAPNYADFVNTADITTNIGTQTATATIKFV